MDPKVDVFLSKAKKWQTEMKKLREIALDTPLNEELKWYQPCYTYDGKNVAIIGCFKEYCAFGFFKGALLKDAKGLLDKPGDNTQSARMIKFTSVKEIEKLAKTLKSYIKESIENEKAGLKVKFKKITEHKIPEELQKKFDKSPTFEKAFRSLTPGRQRAYILHFSSAKQSATREARIEKNAKQILAGKGLNE